MNLTYFKFLFVNTIKRKPIWITWFLFLFTCTCFLIILPLAATMNTLQVWSNTTMSICQTFMGMVAGLFTAVLAINIFKDTNEEGTELIVISKPISRFNVVMSKFALFGVYCLMINLSTVLLSCFTVLLPRTEIQFYGGLLLSMFIGNLVTFGIFGSISIILTLKFAKVGIIITNVIISLIFLIYQALTLFVFPTPLNELNNQHMSASTYIVHNRNLETGEYKEEDVVYFSPSAADPGQLHPWCEVNDWFRMKKFWERKIVEKDPTPVINLTDLASQVALTYMTYGVDKFAERQAKRMFSLTRYYDYQLTTPASPELVNAPLPEDRPMLEWIYNDYDKFDFQFGGQDYSIYLPRNVYFDGIEPLTGTKLRGYTDLIPIGYVKSKELFSSREIFFEKDDWNYYAPVFDAMYKLIYDYRNYLTIFEPKDYSNYSTAFANGKCQRKYYEVVWACFTGHANDPQYVNQEAYQASGLSEFDKTYFRINNVNDLNDRFIQFKNYAFWKAYQEQRDMFLNNRTVDPEESEARQKVYEQYPSRLLTELLLVKINPANNDWFMEALPESFDQAIIDSGSQTPFIDYIAKTWYQEQEDISSKSKEEKINLGLNSSWSIYKRTSEIVYITSQRLEEYLFSSLEQPTRLNKNTGSAYISWGNWLPNIHSWLFEEIMPPEEILPVGQNLQWFYYSVEPRIQYWVFALIWGAVAAGLFATGIILYNKFDVK